jgi:hypothetical protein
MYGGKYLYRNIHQHFKHLVRITTAGNKKASESVTPTRYRCAVASFFGSWADAQALNSFNVVGRFFIEVIFDLNYCNVSPG